MTVELSRRLLASGVPSSDIEAALFLSVARGIPVARALIDRGVVSERALEEELSRWAGIALRQVSASTELWARLPLSMCRRLGALPLRVDAATGTVEVAAIDPLDPHVGVEFGFHLGMPVRVLRATLGAIEEAIRRLELGDTDSSVSRSRRRTPAFPHGAPKSSSPPPPPEEVPIPLMRRVSVPLLEHDDTEISLVRPRISRSMSPDAAQPSVSFPSSPPPSGGTTPMVAVEAPTPLRSLTPMMGTSSLVLPPRSTTPLQGTVPAVNETHDTEPHLQAFPALNADPQRPSWYAPSETLEAGFRRAAGETLPPSTTPNRSTNGATETHSQAATTEPPRARDPGSPGQVGEDTNGEELTKVLPLATPPPLPVVVSLDEVLDLLGDAQGRDGVVDAALRAMAIVAPRAAVFVVRKDGYHGWVCSPAFGDQAALRTVMLPHHVPNILATATAAGFYLGPVPSTPGHAALLAVMKHAGPDVAVSVVRVAGKPAIVLIAEGLDDTLRGTKALSEIAKVAGFALSRVLSSR